MDIFWKALIKEGVSAEDYSFEQLKQEYLSYGASQIIVRNIGTAYMEPNLL